MAKCRADACYYKFDKKNRKRYYRLVDDKNIRADQITNVENVEFDEFTYFMDLDSEQKKIAKLRERLSKSEEVLQKYQVDRQQRDHYQGQFWANQARSLKPEICYVKISANDCISHYSYMTGKLIPKRKAELLTQDGIEPFIFLKEHKLLLEEIAGIQARIDYFEAKIAALTVTYEELLTRREAKKAALKDGPIITRPLPPSTPPRYDTKDEKTEIEELQCPICIENKNRVAMNCGHLLCITCYHGILEDKGECPHCRQKITTSMLIYQ